MKKILITLLVFGISSVELFAQVTANINTSSPAVPFGSKTSYPYGVMPTNLPTGGTYGASQDAATAYTNWVKTFVQSCSTGVLRVLWTGNSNPTYTVSEGIGYGMLLAAYAGDKTTFDGLYAYLKQNLDSKGLMNWQIGGCSGTTGSNSASDADEDVAMALIIASNQWPTATSPYTYKNEAQTILNNIRSNDFDQSTHQIINGDSWGSSTCRNPSYQSPGYYTEFAKFDASNASFWNSCTSGVNTLLLGNRNTTTGLVSNWCPNTSPYADNNCNGSGTGFGYDACRNPWRMSVDVLWHGNSSATTASDICTKLSAWMKGYENNLKGPLAQNAANPSVGTYKNGVFTTFACAPMATATTSANLNTCYTNVVGVGFENTEYFNASLRCLTLFVMSGNFWKPGTSNTGVAPIVTSATTNSTGSTITVNFSTSISFASTDYSQFTLLIGGTAVSAAITSISANGTSAVNLTIAAGKISAGNVITLNYTPGSIKSTAATPVALAAFTGQVVTNALAGNSTVLDDMEDDNNINNLGGPWFSFNDASNSGQSTVTPLSSSTVPFTMTAGGPNGSKYYAGITYTLNVGSNTNPPFVGLGTFASAACATSTGTAGAVADWTGSTGLTFYYKGTTSSTSTFEIEVATSDVGDYGYFAKTLPASSAWTKYTLLWTDLAQPSWASVKTFNVKHIQQLLWQVNGALKTDISTGAFGVDSIVVNGLVIACTTPTVTSSASKTVVCSGNSIILTASGASTYQWSTGATTSIITVNPAANVTYIVTGTTATGGCTANTSQAITVNALPTANAGSDISICKGNNTVLNATGGGTYAWSNGIDIASNTVSPAVTSTYTVTVTSNSCSATDNVVVTVNVLPTANAGSDVSICQGNNTTLSATGGGIYAWSNGIKTASNIVSPTVTSTYTVTVTSNSCSATDNVVVTVNALPTANAGSDVSICQGNNTTLSATGGDTYVWSNGIDIASNTVSPTVTSTYTVTATFNSCSATDIVVVTVNAIPETPVISIGINTILSSNASSNNQWYDQEGIIQGATGSNYTPLSSDDYYVIVTSNGCSSPKSNTLSVTVTGIVDVNEKENISIYPNPAAQFVQIEGNLNDANISIRNIVGEVVINKNIKNSEKEQIDISNLKQGLYFISISQAGKNFTQKIIKE